MTTTPEVTAEDLHDRFLKTYRYLRVAMVVLLALLLISVLWEYSQVKPLRPSISDYYYSPVRAIFVGTLTALGVCMIVLKGNTAWEDTFLNLVGMLAPVVALVPTRDAGVCTINNPGVADDILANINNNVLALLVAGVMGVLIWLGLVVMDQTPTANKAPVGFGFAVVLILVASGLGWFIFGDRNYLACNGHNFTAIPMFCFLVAVVWGNAWAYEKVEHPTSVPWVRRAGQAAKNRYGVIAVTIVVLSAIFVAAGRNGFEQWVFFVECVVLISFLTFWVVQSKELWRQGIRGAPMANDPA
jgi:hypothetical protein